MRVIRYALEGPDEGGLHWLPPASRPAAAWTAALPRVSFTECDLALSGQRLTVTPGRYDWVYLIVGWGGDQPAAAAAPLVIDDVLWLEFRGGLDREHLRTVPGAIAPGRGAVAARAGVPRRDDLLAVTLPTRPGLRVLATGLARGDGQSPSSATFTTNRE